MYTSLAFHSVMTNGGCTKGNTIMTLDMNYALLKSFLKHLL